MSIIDFIRHRCDQDRTSVLNQLGNTTNWPEVFDGEAWMPLAGGSDRALADIDMKCSIAEMLWRELQDRGDGATEGRVDCVAWDALARIAESWSSHRDFAEQWGGKCASTTARAMESGRRGVTELLIDAVHQARRNGIYVDDPDWDGIDLMLRALRPDVPWEPDPHARHLPTRLVPVPPGHAAQCRKREIGDAANSPYLYFVIPVEADGSQAAGPASGPILDKTIALGKAGADDIVVGIEVRQRITRIGSSDGTSA